MGRVAVVTGWVPLQTRHVTEAYHDNCIKMLAAAVDGGAASYVGRKELKGCHAYMWKDLRPAMYPEPDRYPTEQDCTNSNIVQHERLIWALEAWKETRADVLVWLDYGLLKQGHNWKAGPVLPIHVKEFVERVSEVEEWNEIPFPGIWNMDYDKPWDPPVDGWAGVPFRFVGSTHIWPIKYLPEIATVYYSELARFITRTQRMPVDLPIWCYTERRSPWLPWRQYLAEYDRTQLTNYWPLIPMSELCELSRSYGCDKGGRHLIAGDTCHEYTIAYHERWKDRRASVRRLLEVGVNHGASLRMWQDYFPNAEIIGLDIDPRTMFQEGRIRTFLCDQSNAASLYKVMNQLGDDKFDIIIDDGSHEPASQILTAQVLMPYLKKDGEYYIEDVYHDSALGAYASAIGGDYRFNALVCPNGIGRACDPDTFGPEQLLVLRHPD